MAWNKEKIRRILREHGIPYENGADDILVRAGMFSNEISDVICVEEGRLFINGEEDDLYSWLGY